MKLEKIIAECFTERSQPFQTSTNTSQVKYIRVNWIKKRKKYETIRGLK